MNATAMVDVTVDIRGKASLSPVGLTSPRMPSSGFRRGHSFPSLPAKRGSCLVSLCPLDRIQRDLVHQI